MQHSQKILLPQAALRAIATPDANRLKALQEQLETHKESIAYLLTAYHWAERGIVHGIETETGSVQIAHNGSGQFTVKYGINIHYGCSDVDVELNNKMTITMNIDLQTGETLLTGEHIPDREPDTF